VDDNEDEEKEEQVEHREQSEPLSTPNLSKDMEVSIEAPSFIFVPLEAHHNSKASVPQCLEEPSYVKILNNLCTQAHKSKDHLPKKIRLSKQVG
jgi:hypothetical protein